MSEGYPFDWAYVDQSSSFGNIFRPMINIQIKTKSGGWSKFGSRNR